MLYGEELLKSIQSRCRIQPGMLIRSRPEGFGENAPHGGKVALVTKVSPGCKFDGTTKVQKNTSSMSVSPLTARMNS